MVNSDTEIAFHGLNINYVIMSTLLLELNGRKTAENTFKSTFYYLLDYS